MARVLLVLEFAFLALGSSTASLTSFAGPRPFTVVIDPGHGGSDHGAVTQSSNGKVSEKEITLLLAKQLARQLNARKIRTELTRTEDVDLSLSDRTAIANRLGADLFISIHLNSSQAIGNGKSRGVETYFLNHSTDQASKRLADLENSVLKGSVANQETPGDLSLIVKDLILDGNLKESKNLACLVQDHLVQATSSPEETEVRNLGVKQALFYVLLGADMPSILVEAGFLNNLKDRRLVTTLSGRQLVGKAMTDAIVSFQKQKDSSQSIKCKIL